MKKRERADLGGKKKHQQKTSEARRKRGKRRGVGGSHCCQVVVLARHLKPGSECLERIMSFDEPKTLLHNTIWRSRGSREVILKNLLVSEWASRR